MARLVSDGTGCRSVLNYQHREYGPFAWECFHPESHEGWHHYEDDDVIATWTDVGSQGTWPINVSFLYEPNDDEELTVTKDHRRTKTNRPRGWRAPKD